MKIDPTVGAKPIYPTRYRLSWRQRLFSRPWRPWKKYGFRTPMQQIQHEALQLARDRLILKSPR